MINSLRLQNFRCYRDSQFEFSYGVNIIFGPNGSGKTSIIEALGCILEGGSYKSPDIDLIAYNKPWTRLDVSLNDLYSTRTIKIQLEPQNNTIKSYVLDNSNKKRLDYIHQIPYVLFEPKNMNIFTSNTASRREFLDQILLKIIPNYSTHLKNYKRILAQRNSLLKSILNKKSSIADLFVWDLRLSELSFVIYSARQNLIAEFNKTITNEYLKVSGTNDSISINYITNINAKDYTAAILKKLTNDVDKDILRGFTGAGPHRDDFEVSINTHNVKASASRGETRSIVLALKIIELQIITKALNIKPILFLDDVFSELDGKRRKFLAESVSSYQTFITTTDADLATEHFIGIANLIPITKDI